MPLDKTLYIGTKPGLEEQDNIYESLIVASDSGILGQFPAFYDLSQYGNTAKVLMRILPAPPIYVATDHGVTEVKDNTGTIATTAATGVLTFTTNASPSDNDDLSIQGPITDVLVQNKWYVGFCRVKVSSAANMGLIFGLQTAGAQPLAADPADGLYFKKAKNAATLTAEVVENSNASDDTGTLATMADDTYDVLGFRFKIGTSATVGTVLEWLVDGTKTAGTPAQLDALYKMYGTSVATVVPYIGFRVNSTTARTADVHSCLVFREV
jgi:hypothetical protein